MSYLLMTDEQKTYVDMIRTIGEKELAPKVEDLDKSGEFPMDVFKKLAEAGFYGINIPEAYGGPGFDAVTQCLLHEELGKIDAGFAFSFFMSSEIFDLAMLSTKDEGIRKYVAEAVLYQHKMLAFCLTEPNAGSDASNVATTALRDGDEYILNGTKCFISNGNLADIFFVGASTDKSKGSKGISLFMVERKHGIKHGKHEDKMGIRLSNTTDIIMEDVRVPAKNLLGVEGKGLNYLLQFLEQVRFSTMAYGLGAAQRALDYAVSYAKERVQFGKPIIANQGVSFKLAEMQANMHAARAIILYAAETFEKGIPLGSLSPSAKLIASEAIFNVANSALQVLGGYGYMREYPIEKILRDTRIFSIFEGTNEIQKVVISGFLAK